MSKETSTTAMNNAMLILLNEMDFNAICAETRGWIKLDGVVIFEDPETPIMGYVDSGLIEDNNKFHEIQDRGGLPVLTNHVAPVAIEELNSMSLAEFNSKVIDQYKVKCVLRSDGITIDPYEGDVYCIRIRKYAYHVKATNEKAAKEAAIRWYVNEFEPKYIPEMSECTLLPVCGLE